MISEGSNAPEKLNKSFSYLLDKKSLETALQNTRAYCCSQKSLTNKDICKNADSANNFPESPYIYDHLVDVALRKRDGRKDIAYNLEVDPKTQAYREYIAQIASKPNGNKPDDIIKKIKERRIPNGSPFIKTYSEKICKNTNRNELENKTLYEKLANVCTIARCAYDALTDGVPEKDTTIATAVGYENCQTMISDKIYSEFQYMNIVTTQAANRKLSQNFTEYLTNYFARDRLLNLQNKIGEIFDAFVVVDRFVQEGTKQCSG